MIIMDFDTQSHRLIPKYEFAHTPSSGGNDWPERIHGLLGRAWWESTSTNTTNLTYLWIIIIYLPSQLANSKLDDDDTIVTRQDQGDFWPWILAPDWRYGRQIWSSGNIPYLVLLMNPIFIYCNQILLFQATIDNGFVTIRGRIKDVIITSGGKNIAPNNVN